MEEILRNAFDKIRADDELKRRIICYLSCKKKEIGGYDEQKNKCSLYLCP